MYEGESPSDQRLEIKKINATLPSRRARAKYGPSTPQRQPPQYESRQPCFGDHNSVNRHQPESCVTLFRSHYPQIRALWQQKKIRNRKLLFQPTEGNLRRGASLTNFDSLSLSNLSLNAAWVKIMVATVVYMHDTCWECSYSPHMPRTSWR